MSKGGEKSLWDLAIDQAHNAQGGDDSKESKESSIVFVGSKNSGKTSIILRFLDRDEAPKPTVALEYTFGRRARGHNIIRKHTQQAKDVAHIWELGGGTWLSKLIDIPINADSISNIALTIVVDLSLPNELWFTLENLLQSTKATVDAAISDARVDDPHIRDKLKKMAWERVGEEHLDKDMLDPFLIPLVIIGGKYDVFQDFDPEKRKIICRTLRFIAHTHGAHLQFFSTKQEALMTRARALVSHLVFGTAGSKSLQTEHNKPLLIPPGMDAMQQIGSPPLKEGDLGRVTARNPMELWKMAYVSSFPQENTNNPAAVEDPAKDPQYAEAAIDTLRAQKDEELERYRKLCERRAKEAAQRAPVEGLA